MAQHELLAISALFLAKFDQKVGYTIAWKRSLEGIDLDGVEYQCLPSGLHSVREDLVYFTKEQLTHSLSHEVYAGVSAFVQEKADEQHRNAEFAAVGILLAQRDRKTARSWLYADTLRALARDVVQTTGDLRGLESFWEKYGREDGASGASPVAIRPELSGGLKRKRANSDAAAALQLGYTVPTDHPALSMPALLDTFGPLVFPLYRAALLRKRILLLGVTPVQPACNYVYDLSTLSIIPEQVQSKMVPSSSTHRLEPLFNVGIFDILRLKEQARGYLACTTDDILGEKTDLYDVLVEVPPSDAVLGAKSRPKLRTSDGQIIRASQRDFRRYGSLRRGLQRLQCGHTSGMQYRDDASATQDDGDDAPLIQPVTSLRNDESEGLQAAEAEVVEPESWGSIAYRSFMWWAAASELEAWEAEEALTDQSLLDHLPHLDGARTHCRTNNDCDSDAQTHDDDDEALDPTHDAKNIATILTTYFYRLTALTLESLASARDNAGEGGDEDVIDISADDARRIGIDSWNRNDCEFVEQAMELYYGRKAVVSDDGLQLCGVRIC